MENQLPTSQPDQPNVILAAPFLDKFKQKKLILPGFFLVILLAAAFFYMKAQPIKKTIPKPYNPGKSASQSAQFFPPPTAFQKGPFVCPAIPGFCQTGKDISAGTSYIGFGAKLPAKSPVFASFDGELVTAKIIIAQSPTDKKTQNILVATVTDKIHLLRAAYYFTGQPTKDRKVITGEIIATSSGELMPLYDNSSLVFVLTRNDTTTGKRLGGERVRLTQKDFK